jgi:hypothetical protein
MMSDDKNNTRSLTVLRIALVVIGLTFVFGIYTLTVLWPSGWRWGQWSSHYPAMILGVYERGHLTGDVPALLVVAVVLTLLMPRAGEPRQSVTPA